MRRIVAALALLGASAIAGCHSEPEKHYAVLADVISTDVPHQLIVVKHGDIPGLMPGMTMTYQVADVRQIETLQPGDKISAVLVVSASKGRLEDIELVSKGNGKANSGTTQRIPQPGNEVPDIALRNQDGKIIRLRNFAGKVLLVTFIYTRCPLPDYCPRMNENFLEVQKLLVTTPKASSRTAFLSISFDPQHDSPQVLKHYAAIYKKGVPGEKPFEWQFAAPREKDLPELAQFFGLVYELQQAQIVHSLSTTLIGPDGKVVQWYSGNDWKPSDVSDAISALLQKGS